MLTTQRITGNRCGHDPLNPVTTLKKQFTNQPAILRTLAERIERFNKNRAVIPMLCRANGSKRTRRSESAESISLVLKCIAKYIDLVTFKVGFYNQTKWFNLSYNEIEKQTGLSKFRILRAMSELQRVGLIGLHEVYDEVIASDGTIMRFAQTAVKTVNLALFAIFGMEKTCIKERKKASNRRAKKANKTTETPEGGNVTGFAMAKATFQALKHASKQADKKARRTAKQSGTHYAPITWDDDIPY